MNPEDITKAAKARIKPKPGDPKTGNPKAVNKWARYKYDHTPSHDTYAQGAQRIDDGKFDAQWERQQVELKKKIKAPKAGH